MDRVSDRNSNGRPTPPKRSVPAPRPIDHDGVPALRRRSPLAYWVAVLVLLGLVASVLGSVVASFAR